MSLISKLDQLKSLPAFRMLSAAEIEQVTALFEPRTLQNGETLFSSEDTAETLYILLSGEIVLYQADQETHRLKPLAMVGELGALAGLQRNSRAIAENTTEVWQTSGTALSQFILENPSVGTRLQQGILIGAADKINRDQTRISDMRRNIIVTQKAMKRMREFVEESPDTVVSRHVHDIIEGLIKQNRRVNYRVEPPPSLNAALRQDDRTRVPVTQISRTHLSLTFDSDKLPDADSRLSGVLCLSGPEIPISGKVLRTIDRRVDVEFDLLIDEYVATLEGYLTRVQMFDFLV